MLPALEPLPCLLHYPPAQAQGPDLTDEEMRQQNPLAALLRSLLPWVNLGQAPEYGADEAEGEAGGERRQPEGGGGRQ